MTYQIKRVMPMRRGDKFREIWFDLWNYQYNVGYEIKVTIYNKTEIFDYILKYAQSFRGEILDISKIDYIIRKVKQGRVFDNENNR